MARIVVADSDPRWPKRRAASTRCSTSRSGTRCAGLCRRYGEIRRAQAAANSDVDAYTRAKTSLVREALLSVGHEPSSGWAASDVYGFRSSVRVCSLTLPAATWRRR